jgi:GxxExxY protein
MKQEATKPGNPVDELTDRVIGAAIRDHRELGPGFLESIYEAALAIEFTDSRIRFERQKPLSVLYREHHVGEHRLDFLVENAVVVELKTIVDFEKVHFAIVRSYLKAASIADGLLLQLRNSNSYRETRRPHVYWPE